jgi:sn-glycerol 3-phosphate transport system substrate-binding protein
MNLTRRATIALAAATVVTQNAYAEGATEIDFFFPVPVQGALAAQMQKLIARFNSEHPAINVTAVYTGSYDDTNLKTRTAIKAGKPPALALMSANFVREYVINGEVIAFDELIAANGGDPDSYFDRFWPALKPNAVIGGRIFGVPFQNSTPLLYYNTDAFMDAGLDPGAPPANWQEWLDAAKKLTKPDGSRTGLMFPGTYDYCGWITSALTMANGGQYYNHDYGGEVYYGHPTTIGALAFIDTLVNRAKVMPPGVSDANACTSAFFAGRTGMMVLSTGALSFVRNNMKLPYRVAFLPGAVRRAATIGGGSLIIPKGNAPERQKAAWTLIEWLTSPAISGEWSRFTGYFAPNKAAYDLPEMQSFLKANSDAKVALDQLAYAQPWFDTYSVVAVRKAIEDQIQGILSGKAKPAEAAAEAQKAASELLLPYINQTALHDYG